MAAFRFTKEQRQQIVKDFAVRHNGTYNPKLFVEEVRKVGEKHPAYRWFEWNQDKAAFEYQLSQARAFAQDLRITFEVEKVGRNGSIRIVQTEMPMVLSPVSGREDGGGYVLSDPKNQDHMTEYCHQAGSSLRTWLGRYQAAITHAGMKVEMIEEICGRLEGAAPASLQAAE